MSLSEPRREASITSTSIAPPRYAVHIISLVLLMASCLGVFAAGVVLRHWAWDQAVNLHFVSDVSRAYMWGTRADQEGLFSMYREIRGQYGDSPPQEYGLDYAPLRLTIATLWARWVNLRFGGGDEWNPAVSFQFHGPLLLFNTVCEASAAIGVILVLRLMRKIANPAAAGERRWGDRAKEYFPLALAGLLVWFNPALILNDCWPQWDCWILPPFIFALYCCMRGWWLAGGLLLGLGAMFKGQILCVVPIFILWPLFLGQWKSVIRLAVGAAVSFTLIATPWMLTTRTDIEVAAIGPVCAAVILLIKKGWRRPWSQVVAAAVLVIPIWVTPIYFSGDMSWLVLPYAYGPVKHPEIATVGTSNLAALLEQGWGWEAEDAVDIPLPSGHSYEASIRVVLGGLYAATLLAASIGAAIQWHRRSNRFLLAMSVPWLLFFSLLPYMNNRYLMWSAALFPLLIPMGLGMTLLGGLICLASCAMFLEIMTRNNSGNNPSLSIVTHGLYPGMAYMVLTIAAVFLYNSLVVQRKTQIKSAG